MPARLSRSAAMTGSSVNTWTPSSWPGSRAWQRAFLTRTAVLERMSGPLCDAVLKQTGSGETLTELERSNLLLVPLDRRGEWYRYHHLFRDMLLAELRRGARPDARPLPASRAVA